jgi:hypothetical protein
MFCIDFGSNPANISPPAYQVVELILEGGNRFFNEFSIYVLQSLLSQLLPHRLASIAIQVAH